MNRYKKEIFIGLGILVLIVAAAVAYWQSHKASTDIDESREVVTSKGFGITFSYPNGENGFTLVEPPAGENGILKSYVMIPKAEYEVFKNTETSAEAPATISILIFALDEEKSTSTEAAEATSTEYVSRITRLQNWATDNDVLTSFTKTKATPDIIELDGVQALHYQTDGLYQQDIYLASYKNRVYMFVGQYNDESDITYIAFQELIKQVSL